VARNSQKTKTEFGHNNNLPIKLQFMPNRPRSRLALVTRVTELLIILTTKNYHQLKATQGTNNITPKQQFSQRFSLDQM